MMQNPTSCLNDSLKFFPCFPFKKTVMVEQNLWSWPQNVSPLSLPRFLAFLKKATYLSTNTCPWSLAFEQQAAEPEFNNNHPALFTGFYVTEIILYNLQQKEPFCLVFPPVIALEFYENFFLVSKFKDSFCFIILIIIYYPLSGMQIVKVNNLSIFLILL